MALFGGHRDVSLFRKINREVINNIISQQAAFYKVKLNQTRTNMYGESIGKKYYIGPVLFNCLIDHKDRSSFQSDIGINTSQLVDFMLLRDDLVDSNYVPEIGDIILYEEGYFEINDVVENQYHMGKDPSYPNSKNGINPLNPNLDLYGYNVSIICKTHSINSDKVGITKERLK